MTVDRRSLTLARVALLTLLPVVAVQCEGIGAETSDASADASKPLPISDANLPDVVLPTCGDAACVEPPLGVLAEAACCLPSGGCGLRSLVLSTPCLPRAPARGADLACPPRTFPGGNALVGCCGDDGRCGLLDTDGELGCVPTAADAFACAYNPNNDCTRIVELPCDGPEDCPAGNVCCGRAQRDRYDAFGCFISCDGVIDDRGGVWLEICHPWHACKNPRFTCERGEPLPSFLARCREPAPPPLPDAGDASLKDASVADASVADASVADASVADASVADASSEDNAASPPPPLARLVPVVEMGDLLPFGPLPRGVACGPATCKEGEKCCLRTHAAIGGTESGVPEPIDSYCERADMKCSCLPEVDP